MSLDQLCLGVEARTPDPGNIGLLVQKVSSANRSNTPKTEIEIFNEMLSQGVTLIPTELAVFSQLYNSSPRLVPRAEIDEQVWGKSDNESVHTLNVNLNRINLNVNRIKLKIRQAGVDNVYIITNTRGLGYKLTVTENARGVIASEYSLENLHNENPAQAEDAPSDGKPLHEAGSIGELCQILGVDYSKPTLAAKALWALTRRNGETVGRCELASEVWGVKVETSQQYRSYDNSLRQLLSLARGLVKGTQIRGFNYKIGNYPKIGYMMQATRADNAPAQARSEAR